MGKKNPQRQPFYFYMQHRMHQMRSSGRSVSLHNMPGLVGEDWKKLSPEEKYPFEEKARIYKECRVGGAGGDQFGAPLYGSDTASDAGSSTILTSIGTSVAAEEEQERENELYDIHLKGLIEEAVNTAENIKTKKFYFISFNVLCPKPDGGLLANEFGIVEWTMQDGIRRKIHMFLDGGEIPLGFTRIAKEHMEATHKIPICGFSEAIGNEKNEKGRRDILARQRAFDKVALDILQFTSEGKIKNDGSDNDQILLFTPSEQIEQTRECLKFIADVSENVEFTYHFAVLDVLYLLFNICRKNPSGKVRPLAICDGDLKISMFDYTLDTNCHFHEEQDNKNCALGVAKRLCYMISDVTCKLFNITATTNHMPKQTSDAFQSEEYKMDEKAFNFNPHNQKKRYFEDEKKFKPSGENSWSNNIRVPKTDATRDLMFGNFSNDLSGPSTSGIAPNDPKLNRPRDQEKRIIGGVGRGVPKIRSEEKYRRNF